MLLLLLLLLLLLPGSGLARWRVRGPVLLPGLLLRLQLHCKGGGGMEGSTRLIAAGGSNRHRRHVC